MILPLILTKVLLTCKHVTGRRETEAPMTSQRMMSSAKLGLCKALGALLANMVRYRFFVAACQECRNEGAENDKPLLTKWDLAKDTQNQQSDHQADLLAFEEQRLPYSAQHTVLVTAQRLLEEACFEFAQRYMPSVLQSAGYDCPAAVELTQWATILTKHRFKLGKAATSSLKTPLFPALVLSMRTLRNTAVHRIPASTAVVCQLVSSAADLAEVLQESARASLMREICGKVDATFKEADAVRQALTASAHRELEEIRQAREELNKREKAILAKTLSDDAECRRELGHALKQAVGHTIMKWEEARASASSGGNDNGTTDLQAVKPGNDVEDGDAATVEGSDRDQLTSYNTLVNLEMDY